MKTILAVRYAIGVSAFAIAIAGCGSSQTPVATGNVVGSQAPQTAVVPQPKVTPLYILARRPARSGWLSPAAKRQPVIYVANGDQVLLYSEAGRQTSPIGMITSGVDYAYGLYVDRSGTLYVSNWNNNTVTAYAAGSTMPSATYSQDLSRPLYPIVDRYGDLFVGNANRPTVVEYKPGSTAAYQVLNIDGVEADGLAFDQQGNLYVAYRNSAEGLGSIEEFAPGSTTGQSLGMVLNQPQGVIVDSNNNILAVETGATRRVDVFAPGSQTPSGQLGIHATPTELAMKGKELHFFISSLGGELYGSSYPLHAPPRTFPKDQVNSLIQGVAINNPYYF